MSSGAIIAAKQNKYIGRFREAGATTPDEARTLREVGCRDSLVFRGLTRRGVFVAGPDGRYHLDVAAAEAFVARRRAVVLVAVTIAVLVMVLVLVARG